MGIMNPATAHIRNKILFRKGGLVKKKNCIATISRPKAKSPFLAQSFIVTNIFLLIRCNRDDSRSHLYTQDTVRRPLTNRTLIPHGELWRKAWENP